jgi:hypothetical protein
MTTTFQRVPSLASVVQKAKGKRKKAKGKSQRSEVRGQRSESGITLLPSSNQQSAISLLPSYICHLTSDIA